MVEVMSKLAEWLFIDSSEMDCGGNRCRWKTMPVATVEVQSVRKSQLRGLGPCPQKGILSNVLGVTGSLPSSVGLWSSHRWSFSTPEDEQRHSSGLRLEEGRDREQKPAAQGFTD